MISLGSNTKVYLASGATDMRKAIDGLMVVVQDVLEADPFSSHLFVFCNRLRDKIKILYWHLWQYLHSSQNRHLILFRRRLVKA